MNSTIETLDGNMVKVSVDVAEKELEGAIEAAFQKIAKEVRLPGFRPGKVPRKVLEARFGTEYARGEALQSAIPELYVKAVREHEVDVIAAPEFEITEGETDGPVRFEAVVETRPEIEVSGYDALEVEIPSPVVADSDISDHLDGLRGQFGELSTVERAASDGDHVTIDVSGTHDGEDVSGLTADDYVYEVGSGAVVDEIDHNLRGAKVGDILEFSAEHPDPDTEGELDFRVFVKEVQEKVLPDLNDEFAAQASEFDTLAELTTDVTEKLTAAKRRQAASAASDKIGLAIAELVAIEAPEALIDSDVQQRLQDIVMRLRSQGIDVDQYFEISGQTPETLAASLREPAATSVKVDLALRHVAKAESLVSDDGDLSSELEELAAQLGSDVNSVRDQFETMGTLFELRADIAKRKAMEWITERATLVDEDGNTVDRALLDEPDPEPSDTEETEEVAMAADEEEE